MSLSPGQALSFYVIQGALGAGTMGEVYRARDSRLDREVAIKVLPEHFAEDEERLQRFEREAKSLASLNHPNVAQIYAVDQVGDTCFLALELVPGETLEERIARGPLPLDEALDVCRQIAEGLEAAHEAGVIHRDLKPANVRITPDGRVKVLDFGLAKATGPNADGGSTTDSVLATEQGRLLGTPTYMAPEQARGKAIDRRVDVWALGCVLYECLTARRAFAGETLTDVLASVLQDEPDWALLPPATPQRVRELLARSLAKDPRRRLRDCGDASLTLAEPHGSGLDLGAAADRPSPEHASRGSRTSLRFVGLALALILGLGLGSKLLPGLGGDAPPEPVPVVRSSLVLGPEMKLGLVDRPLQLSPDGSTLALVASRGAEPQRIWIRRLDSDVLQPLAGTEDAFDHFWSPDGTELAFFAGGKLKRIPAVGGSVKTICAAESSRGGSWGPGGTIVFTPGPFRELLSVPAAGGTPVALTEPAESVSHRLPHFLPGSRRLIYVSEHSEPQGLRVLDLDSGEDVHLGESRSEGLYSDPGLLLIVRDGNLMAQAFDVDALRLEGEARLVVEDVAFRPFRFTGQYTCSAEGTLVFVGDASLLCLRWIEADGTPGEWIGEPGRYGALRLSPDERSIAVERGRVGGDSELLLIDVATGLGRRLAEGLTQGYGLAWSADGEQLAFGRKSGTRAKTFLYDLERGRETELQGDGWPSDWSPDGRWVVLNHQDPTTDWDILVVPADGSSPAVPFLASSQAEIHGSLSPDGRWLLYSVMERGAARLFVTSFPERGPALPVTGMEASFFTDWLADGTIVFVAKSDERLWSVSTRFDGSVPAFGEPSQLLPESPMPMRQVGISQDRSRVLVLEKPNAASERTLSLIQNWPEAVGFGVR